MAMIDMLTNSLLYSSNLQNSKKAEAKKEKPKVQKKSSFSSMVDKKVEVESLISQGLPAEIAGLSMEDSVIFLKDKIDVAAEQLENDLSAERFKEFKKSISQFMKFVSKNNYEVVKRKRPGKFVVIKKQYFSEVREKDPFVQVHVIDQKLNELAGMILQNYGDKISKLAKLDEIKGLIVDFLAV